MLLILSTPQDLSTLHVEKWLRFYGFNNYVKINLYSINEIEYGFNSNQIYINKPKRFALKDVRAVWIRRYNPKIQLQCKNVSDIIKSSVVPNLISEYKAYLSFIVKNLEHCFWMNHLELVEIPKLLQIRAAVSVGLSVPPTFAISTKKALKVLMDKYKKLVVKSGADLFFQHLENGSLFGYTNTITDDLINNLPNSFPSTLIQEKIEKEFEVRSFSINSQFYSMAIFSQKSAASKTDWRGENLYRNPVRKVPFKLPNEIELKIIQLMQVLNLNSGSVLLPYSVTTECWNRSPFSYTLPGV